MKCIQSASYIKFIQSLCARRWKMFACEHFRSAVVALIAQIKWCFSLIGRKNIVNKQSSEFWRLIWARKWFIYDTGIKWWKAWKITKHAATLIRQKKNRLCYVTPTSAKLKSWETVLICSLNEWTINEIDQGDNWWPFISNANERKSMNSIRAPPAEFSVATFL